MYWIYYLLLLTTDIVGLVLAAYTLPGLWLMLAAAALYAYLTGGDYLGSKSLITLLVFAGGAEIAELFLGGAGAKKAGGSKWGVVGGLVGAVIGGIFLTFPLPILGTIIGICLGSFAGAFAVELIVGRSVGQSIRIGYGAAKGRLFGIASKVSIGVIMFLITLWTSLPIGHRHPPGAGIPTTAPTTQHP